MRNKSFRFYFVVVIMLLLQSCGDSEIYKQLSDVDSFIRQRPDSALAVLRQIDTTLISSVRDRAYYGLMYQMALDKNKIDTTDTRIIAPSVAYYDKHGTPDQRMLAYFYLGRVLYNAERWTESVEAYMESIYEEEKVHDRRTLALAYNDIAEVAAYEGFTTKEQLDYLNHSYDIFMEVKDTVSATTEIYKIANYHANLREYKEALELYEGLIVNPKVKERYKYDLYSNYAFLLSLEDYFNPEQAKETFDKVLSHGEGLGMPSNWGAYLYILYSLGETDAVKELSAELDQAFPDNPFINFWKEKIYAKEGNYPAAYKALKSAFVYQDSLVDNRLKINSIITQKTFFERKNAAYILERKAARLRSAIIVMGLALAFLLVFFIAGAKIRKQRKEKMFLLEASEELKRMQVKSNKKYSTEISKLKEEYVSLFKNNLKDISLLCENYLLSKEHGGGSVSVNIKRQLDRLGFDNEKYPVFERKVDKVLDGIMSSFRKDYPNFKEIDYRLFCYTVSGFDPHFITLLMGIENPGVLYSRKLRMKKRIEESSILAKRQYLEYFNKAGSH